MGPQASAKVLPDGRFTPLLLSGLNQHSDSDQAHGAQGLCQAVSAVSEALKIYQQAGSAQTVSPCKGRQGSYSECAAESGKVHALKDMMGAMGTSLNVNSCLGIFVHPRYFLERAFSSFPSCFMIALEPSSHCISGQGDLLRSKIWKALTVAPSLPQKVGT
ncbi:uncharacterized protein RAG0_03513 [Rhynchosporium agropyri]|uniref:Uncharacterized protein n=1 Tax=Rhynchosporium agropyri TaxID=914238 RepID=A0A1E1K4J9_9HELO|nr:uncharacterized protein RAG0_03513 [Rhynchosporium agropyri]